MKKFLLFVFSMSLVFTINAQSNALLFHGISTDNASIADAPELNPTTAITVEALIFANNWRDFIHEGTIVGKEEETGNKGYILRTGSNGDIQFNLGLNGSWQDAVTTSNPMVTGIWYHVAGVYDGTTIKLYIDGVEVASSAATGSIGVSTKNLEIGRLDQYNSRYFDGMIDEVRIWDVAVDAATIVSWKDQTINGTHPNYSNLICYYELNDDTDPDVAVATVGANGIVTGATYVGYSLICPNPSALTATNITTTTADLTWTTGGTAIWNIEYGPTGYTQGTGTLITETTTNPHNLSSLTAATAYDFYVQDDCGGADLSAWVGPISFTTMFNSPSGVTCVSGGTAAFVFSDDMETASGWIGNIGIANDQWDFPTADPGGNSVATGPFGPASGITYAEFEASGSTTNTASMVSPMIDLTSVYDEAELSFYMHAYGADIGTLNVGVGTSSTGPFTNVFSWTGQLQTVYTDPWVLIGVDLSSYIGEQIYIEFNYGATGGGNEGDLAIDLVQVETCFSCSAPSSLTALNIMDVSADLAWTEIGSATSWNIELGASPLTPTGTPTQTGVTNPYNYTGLTAFTSYEYYVQADCGSGDLSPWAGPYTFSTGCGPFTAPYVESFDLNTTPNCWSQSAIEGGPWQFGQLGSAGFEASNADEHTGNSGYYAWVDFSSADTEVILEMNNVDISALTVPALSFYFYSHNTLNADINFLYVESWDGNTWQTVNTINEDNGGWTKYVYDITTAIYNTDLVKIRFRAESAGVVNDNYNDWEYFILMC